MVRIETTKIKLRHTLFLAIILTVCSNTCFGQKWNKLDSSVGHFFFNKIKKYEEVIFSRKYHDSLLTKNSIAAQDPNSIQVKPNALPSYEGKSKIVFGWHPYWSEECYQNYNYKLLSHIAYFSCDVDTLTGKLKDEERWENSKIISYAKHQNPGCKVLLTVTCLGSVETSTFLKSQQKQNTLIQHLYNSIVDKNADGVCIDFENIKPEMQAYYETFISKLNKQFKKNNLLVFITLPSVQPKGSNPDFKTLVANTDALIILAYDYFGGFTNGFDGPIAPLNVSVNNPEWIQSSVASSVNFYLKTIPDSMLILGVPYFGGIWEVNGREIPGKTINFLGYRSYSSAINLIDIENKFINDSVIGASYFSYETVNKTFRHYWMETPYSISSKYDFAMNKKLKGVAIFALSFDYGTNDLWNIINQKFYSTTDKLNSQNSSKVVGIDEDSTIARTIIKLTKENPYSAGLIIFLILFTLLVALLKVNRNKANRGKLRSNK